MKMLQNEIKIKVKFERKNKFDKIKMFLIIMKN